MRPRRPKQYCLQLVIYIHIYIYIYIERERESYLPQSLYPVEGLAGQRILVTSMTVPRSDGDETGKDNSGRAEGVLESVGFKHIY